MSEGYNPGNHSGFEMPELSSNRGQVTNQESQDALLGEQHQLKSPEVLVSSVRPVGNGKPSVLRSFPWEMVCLVLATGSLVALTVLLQTYNDHQVPDWTLGRTEITLNAVVSILSTLFRSLLSIPVAQSISQLCWVWYKQPRSLRDACYYDSASRGPWGSVQLLLKLRFVYVWSRLALDWNVANDQVDILLASRLSSQ